jgi:hypothetical protein
LLTFESTKGLAVGVPTDVVNGPVEEVLRNTLYESAPVTAVHDTVTREIPAVAVTPPGMPGTVQEWAGTAGVELGEEQVPPALVALTT